MVDLPNRADYEAQLARRIGKANAEARRVFLRAIEDGRLDEDEWSAIARAYQNVLQAGLEQTSFAAGVAAAEQLGIGVDPAALHARAIDWARTRAAELVTQMKEGDQQFLRGAVSDYFSQNMTLADLEARIATRFDVSRAMRIAVTETTRASAEGRAAYAQELEQMGLQPVLIVKTAADERVCPICGPQNDKPVSEAGLPPFHVNCRCTTSIELREATR